MHLSQHDDEGNARVEETGTSLKPRTNTGRSSRPMASARQSGLDQRRLRIPPLSEAAARLLPSDARCRVSAVLGVARSPSAPLGWSCSGIVPHDSMIHVRRRSPLPRPFSLSLARSALPPPSLTLSSSPRAIRSYSLAAKRQGTERERE